MQGYHIPPAGIRRRWACYNSGMMLRVLAWPFLAYARLLRSKGGGLATHVKALPFGSAAGTYLVAKFIRDGEWLFWRDWDAVIQAVSLGVLGYSFSVATVEAIIVVGLMAAEYLRNKEKRTNEKMARDLLDSAQNSAERRFALRWADDHGVDVEELRDAQGRRYLNRFRRRRSGRRLRR